MIQLLQPGDLAPWFHAKAVEGNSRYCFDTTAGRAIVLLFAGSAHSPASVEALKLVAAHRTLFDDDRACLFGVSIDDTDVSSGRIKQSLPGIRWFIDSDTKVSRLYGAASDGKQGYQPHWLLLDHALRVVAHAPIERGDAIMAKLRSLIAEGQELPAPVLTVPNLFEPEFCARLIATFEQHGGVDSGFMREENGVTVGKIDHGHKRRSDYLIDDQALQNAIKARLRRRLLPVIARAFQFQATRVERLLVACYDGDDGGGHFRPHRDNTTKGTAHRRFACTINLNAEDYSGGDLRFPEFGRRTYRAPTGGAVIFSCSLLHEALPVTRGKRYAFLPFFYDETAAELRERNTAFVAPELAAYRSGLLAEADETTGSSGKM